MKQMYPNGKKVLSCTRRELRLDRIYILTEHIRQKFEDTDLVLFLFIYIVISFENENCLPLKYLCFGFPNLMVPFKLWLAVKANRNNRHSFIGIDQVIHVTVINVLVEKT